MDEEKTLIIGFDLCDDYSQISCIRKNGLQPSEEPESVCMTPDKTKYLIPTAVCIRENTKEWIIGEEAERCRDRGAGIYIDGLLSKFISGETVTAFDTEVTGEMLMERYFGKVLGIIRQRFQNSSILQLVVTCEETDDKTEPALYAMFRKLGLEEGRVKIISHTMAFMHYVTNQPLDQWVYDVSLFDYGPGGLQYYQLSFGKKSNPQTVVAEHKDLSAAVPYELYLNHSLERLVKGFEAEAYTALHKKLITSVFVVGRGFEGTWADGTLRSLCIGKRVFKGQNLYAKGACYAARSIVRGRTSDYVFLTDDCITSDISLKVTADGREQELPLASVGERWTEAGKSCRVILDNCEELEFRVSDCIRRDSVQEIVKLDSPVRRENKTVRLNISLRFEDRGTAVVKISDSGFGEFYKTNYRVWEQILRL